MAALGDYVYIYGIVGTSYVAAGAVKGVEYTGHIDALVAAGYLSLYDGPSLPGGKPPLPESFRPVSHDQLNAALAPYITRADAEAKFADTDNGSIKPGQEIGASIYTDQFTVTTASWESIPGFELAFPTGTRPVYLSLDMGLVAVEGVSTRATSISYRVLDLDHQVPVLTGYVTAVRRNTVDASEYLLTQSTEVSARLDPNQPLARYVVQVQVPEDQLGPSWYFNVSWAEGIELVLKAVSA